MEIKPFDTLQTVIVAGEPWTAAGAGGCNR